MLKAWKAAVHVIYFLIGCMRVKEKNLQYEVIQEFLLCVINLKSWVTFAALALNKLVFLQLLLYLM